MKLTNNFSLSEFECKCGKCEMPSDVLKNVSELAKQLQILRDCIKKPITINSGYRCPEHNASPKVKGSKNSQHLTGKAVDIKVNGMSSLKVNQAIEQLIKDKKMKDGGLGIYNTFNHYDIRDKKARWDFRK